MAHPLNRITLTTEQAKAIVDANEIDILLRDDEESELLAQNNPVLFAAYVRLVKIADGQ